MKKISHITAFVLFVCLATGVAAQQKALSEQVAETVMNRWKDSFALGSQMVLRHGCYLKRL